MLSLFIDKKLGVRGKGMLNIFICEDNEEQRSKITKIVEDIIFIEDFDMQIAASTDNPNRVLDYIKESKTNGLYFLDVDLQSEINGIKLAEEIREYDPRGFIVFITTHAEMSYLTFMYKVEAMDYIIKDNYNSIKERVHQCINNANKKYSSSSNEIQKVFSIKSIDKVINIEYDKIVFFETSDTIHKVKLHALNRKIEFYAQMKDVEESLDERFCRCHRSFIVNKDHIKEVDKINRVVYMTNGQDCLVSTRGIKELLK